MPLKPSLPGHRCTQGEGGGIKVYPPSEIYAKLVNKNAIKHQKGVPSPKNFYNPYIPSLPKFGKNLIDPPPRISNGVHLCTSYECISPMPEEMPPAHDDQLDVELEELEEVPDIPPCDFGSLDDPLPPEERKASKWPYSIFFDGIGCSFENRSFKNSS